MNDIQEPALDSGIRAASRHSANTSLVMILCGLVLSASVLVSCNKSFPADKISSPQALSTHLKSMETKEEWVGYWRAVGSKVDLPPPGKDTLPLEIQQTAYLALETALRIDTRQTTESQYDEKVFLVPIDNIFTNKPLFWKAYAELANHAYGRRPAIGGYMYGKCSMDPDVWDTYYPVSQVYITYYQKKYRDCKRLAEDFATDPQNSISYREFGTIMALQCHKKLDSQAGCDAIMAVDPKQLQTPKHRNYIQKLQDECKRAELQKHQ